MSKSKISQIYQLKISLDRSKPPIWRRVLVSSQTTLDALHHIIQIAMGWEDSHLHAFTIGKQSYSRVREFEMYDCLETTKFKLSDFVKEEKIKFKYEYDFGDGWEHTILVEKILPADPNQKLPLCIAGKGACPPEDVGGVWGYMHFVEAINDPNHPEYADLRGWYYGEWGDDEDEDESPVETNPAEKYDPTFFDMNGVNEIFKTFK